MSLSEEQLVPIVEEKNPLEPGIEDVLAQMGGQVGLLVWSWPDVEGGDIDCAIRGADPLWPFRIPNGWRLCQRLHYDYGGWYWVLDNGGEVVAIDTLDDPLGLGRDGFRSSLALESRNLLPPLHIRAAYFTLKRLRKARLGIDNNQWSRIKEAAETDLIGYREALAGPLGKRKVDLLVEALSREGQPDAALKRRLARAQRIRRFRTPGRIARALVVGTRRWWARGTRASGVVVEIVGPDGTGKSTLARALPDVCHRLFRRSAHFHWRPHLLPAPGRMVGSQSDPTAPHARPPRSKLLSTALLFYYWADFVVGGWLRYRTIRARSGLVVVERGWWDIAVDPRRYRLNVSTGLVKALGKLVPRPDITFFLDAPASVILARKQELTRAELELQNSVWKEVLGGRSNVAILDAADPAEQLASSARESIVGYLHARCMSRLGSGWAAFPKGARRWLVPRGPRRVARESLRIHHPITTKGRAVWRSARVLSGVGGLRVFARSSSIDARLWAKLASHIPRGANLAVAGVNHPDRHVALVLDRYGNRIALAKVDFDPKGRLALDVEAERIESLGRLLEPPLYPPRILARDEGLLVFEAVDWLPRSRTWELPLEVAEAAGRFFAAGSRNGIDDSTGPAHGDFAPWNLLRTERGWVLIDWEDADDSLPPFFDPLHFMVQTHALLGRPTQRGLTNALAGEGTSGAALAAYAAAAQLPLNGVERHFARYLELSQVRFDPGTEEGRVGLEVRRDLLTSGFDG